MQAQERMQTLEQERATTNLEELSHNGSGGPAPELAGLDGDIMQKLADGQLPAQLAQIAVHGV